MLDVGSINVVLSRQAPVELIEVLRDITVHVERGQILGLVGAVGSGTSFAQFSLDKLVHSFHRRVLSFTLPLSLSLSLDRSISRTHMFTQRSSLVFFF